MSERRGKKTAEEKEGGDENETPTARDFRDHQAAVYNRCEDVLCAVPPPALRTRMRGRDGFGADVHCSSDGGGLEAVALVAKLARCREGLFPALWRMGSRYAVVGTAIKAMEVLKSHLETYRGVWDVGGEKGVKGARSGGGDGRREEISEGWDDWLGFLLLHCMTIIGYGRLDPRATLQGNSEGFWSEKGS